MIISVNWLKKYTDITVSSDELATLIGSRLVEIEGTQDLFEKYKDVVIANVISATPLEGSDHLNVVLLDDGGVVADIERQDDGLVQVVCGAPNVREGLFVAWLPPRATVPETHGDAEPFVLGARKLRGVMSNGMIASAKELGLYDEHDGILEIDTDCEPGASFASVYELDDVLLDIENKSLTHRPDAFGVIGFAREVAAIQGQQFTTPNAAEFVSDSNSPAPSVTIDDNELSARYQAVVLDNVDPAAELPLIERTYLARMGVRPINAIVDATNYVMLQTGQPLHAFDYDKLLEHGDGQVAMSVRAGRTGETLDLLDGRTIELSSEDIVIANMDIPVALAGAMGGSSTEVDGTTTRILLESATFNLYNLRNTQMRHGIFSEAITRFTKGQPAALTSATLARAVDMLTSSTGARVASAVADAYPAPLKQVVVTLPVERITATLGLELPTEDIATILENAEFGVAVADDILTVAVPVWRADIHIPEDIIEEVGRLYGFDEIAPTLPQRAFAAVAPSAFDALKQQIRQTLVRAGANEVLTYSFVHGDVLQRAEQDTSKSYRITNSISPDLQYYRQSLTPSLLGLVRQNVKQGYGEFALFEVNKTHSKVNALVEDGVPAEAHRVGLVYAAKNTQPGAPYYRAKQLLEYLGASLGLELEYRSVPAGATMALLAPFEHRRSARIVDAKSGQAIGVVGEYKKSVARGFKLPEYAAGFELLTEGISLALKHATHIYTPISRYPSSERDICFQVEADVTYGAVLEAAKQVLAEIDLELDIAPLDIYAPEAGDTKNITVRLRLTSHERTLTGDDVSGVVAQVVEAVVAATSAKVI